MNWLCTIIAIQEDLEEYINNNINDSRLRTNYTSIPLIMTENWNMAVGLASGKYLCIIGDDDGINPEIIEATRWADMNNLDALKPTVRALYFGQNQEFILLFLKQQMDY